MSNVVDACVQWAHRCVCPIGWVTNLRIRRHVQIETEVGGGYAARNSLTEESICESDEVVCPVSNRIERCVVCNSSAA